MYFADMLSCLQVQSFTAGKGLMVTVLCGAICASSKTIDRLKESEEYKADLHEKKINNTTLSVITLVEGVCTHGHTFAKHKEIKGAWQQHVFAAGKNALEGREVEDSVDVPTVRTLALPP
jgi:hypothetical protein